MKIRSKTNNMKQFSWQVRVYHEDTDGHGIVYYANYFKFFERARTEMLRSIGFEQDEMKKRLGILFVVKSVYADFIQPAQFNDKLTITAGIDAIKRASMVFNQKVIQPPDNNRVLCQAIVRIACLDADSRRPKAIPSGFMERMKDDS